MIDPYDHSDYTPPKYKHEEIVEIFNCDTGEWVIGQWIAEPACGHGRWQHGPCCEIIIYQGKAYEVIPEFVRPLNISTQ